jgi:hypothetical protein
MGANTLRSSLKIPAAALCTIVFLLIGSAVSAQDSTASRYHLRFMFNWNNGNVHGSGLKGSGKLGEVHAGIPPRANSYTLSCNVRLYKPLSLSLAAGYFKSITWNYVSKVKDPDLSIYYDYKQQPTINFIMLGPAYRYDFTVASLEIECFSGMARVSRPVTNAWGNFGQVSKDQLADEMFEIPGLIRLNKNDISNSWITDVHAQAGVHIKSLFLGLGINLMYLPSIHDKAYIIDTRLPDGVHSNAFEYNLLFFASSVGIGLQF